MDIITPKHKLPSISDSRLREITEQAYEILANQTKPDATIRVLDSGGKDSAIVKHIARFHPQYRGVAHVHTDTGIASDEHSAIVEDLAAQNGDQFLKASPATTYPMLVLKYLFPGAGTHTQMYIMLKERPIQQLKKKVRKADDTKNIVFATGIRQSESTRRANSPEHTWKTKSEVWVSPALYFHNYDVLNYMDYFGLTVPNYHHSVDCWCGAFAQPDERERTKVEHPAQFDYIQRLEKIVELSADMQEAQGKKVNRAYCRWGHGGRGVSDGQKMKSPETAICNTCDGQLAQDGTNGVDPDLEMLRHIERVKQVNDQLKGNE